MRNLLLRMGWVMMAFALCSMGPLEAAGTLEQALHWNLDRAGYLRQYSLVYKIPIDNGASAAPVGNGDLAAVTWQPDHLTWMLNKCDLSGASQVARLKLETPAPIAQRVGMLETRLSLADAVVTTIYEGGKLPQDAGWAWRGGGAAPKPTDADLGTVNARAYIPNGRNVFLLTYHEEAKVAHPLTIVFERWVQAEFGNKVAAQVRGNTLAITYDMKNTGGYATSYAAVLAYDGFPGAAPGQPSPTRTTLTIPAGGKLDGRIAIAVVTNLEAADPLAAATQLAQDSLREDETQRWNAHRAFWQEFWSRSFVDTGHPYLNALYHMALYELGITSRGKYPVKFNGALNLWDERVRDWGAPYWCHNQSEVYLPVYTANHAELADNFHDWIAQVRPETLKAARKSFQVDGAYYPEVMAYNFAIADPEKPVKAEGMGYILSSGVRYALLLWNRYQYTLDEAFLREKAYPVIRDCAMFYANYAKLGADGRYHVAPTMGWEELPLGRDSHPDCAAMRAIFPIAIEAAGLLHIDKDNIPIWQDRLAKAPEYPVSNGVFSVALEEDGTPAPANHFQWQLPNLSGVFPYSVIGIDSPAELKTTAEKTFDRYRFNSDAGHEFLPVIAARLGNADWWRASMFWYVNNFQCFDQGLFNYYNVPAYRNKGDDHPYLEASGIMATAVNEMLLQSYDGKIRVFPAAPAHWPSRFLLRAAGSFLVASEHHVQGEIPYIAIQPVGGAPRTCRVVLPWPQGAALFDGAREIALTVKNGVASFTARPETVYLLLPKGKKPADIPAVTVGFIKEYSPAHLSNLWYGRPDGFSGHTADFPLW